MKREYTPENITALGKNEIFVFGSNLEGRHGGGAARVARERFGAIMGQGVGLQGQSYAIPTMQGGGETIKPYVDEFIKFASEHYDKTFYVTRIGCGIAGFKDEEIAPLFTIALELYNVRLPESFVKIILDNNRKNGEMILTPWPVKHYGVYNLLVDLMLASDGNKADEKLDSMLRLIGTSTRREFLDYPDRELADYLTTNKDNILSGKNTEKILCQIAKYVSIWRNNVWEQAIGRYLVEKAYHLSYLMFRTYDFSKKIQIGFSIASSFDYAFYGTITGRWNCGDNSYMYDDVETCAKFFVNELREHKEEISTGGMFDREKFLTFVSQPYIWQFCHENDNHKATEVNMIRDLLCTTVHAGEYSRVGEFFVPVNDFSRPVYQVGNNLQRLQFPTFFMKEQFIKNMLSKPNETIW